MIFFPVLYSSLITCILEQDQAHPLEEAQVAL